MACLLVLVAAVVDLLDGALARVLKVQSRMGAQLDSLADMVTFGVVPGLIMYHLLAVSWFASENPFGTPVVAFIPAFTITLAAAWRLARFNVHVGREEGSSGSALATSFRGLPTPASAIVVVSLPLAAHLSESGFDQWIANRWIMYGITVVLSLLMVSKLPMAKIGSGHATWIFVGICALILGVGYLAFDLLFSLIPILVVLYIVYSILMSGTRRQSSIVNSQ
jgi:CDP-diacylglycerol--serine O-phosphatidyltransferase